MSSIDSSSYCFPLSPEVSLEILKFLPASSLMRLCQVNKIFKELAEDDSLWKPLCEKRFSIITKREDQTWKQTYQKLILDEKQESLKQFLNKWETHAALPDEPESDPSLVKGILQFLGFKSL